MVFFRGNVIVICVSFLIKVRWLEFFDIFWKDVFIVFLYVFISVGSMLVVVMEGVVVWYNFFSVLVVFDLVFGMYNVFIL